MTETPTVIVVDDDPLILGALGSLIRSVGVQVKTLASVSEFLDDGRPDGPTCLVLDVRLPGRSGLDLQRELAASNIQIPIIFITAHGDIPMSVQAMKEGAIEFLTKPFRDQGSAGRDSAGVGARSRLAGERKGNRSSAGTLRNADSAGARGNGSCGDRPP